MTDELRNAWSWHTRYELGGTGISLKVHLDSLTILIDRGEELEEITWCGDVKTLFRVILEQLT